MPEFEMSHNEVVEAYKGAKLLTKRALPTVGAVLKFSRLLTLLRSDTEEADGIQAMLAAQAEHVEHPTTGQEVLKSPDKVNHEVFLAMRKPSAFKDPGFRINKDDLPKLGNLDTDDEKKVERAMAARQELASEIAMLGPLFKYEEE